AANFTVSNLSDADVGSLRDALASVIGAGGGVINLSNVSGAIVLQSTLPDITQAVTIRGPGAAVLAVSGNKLSRVFRVRPGGSCLLSGLTIQDGAPGCDDWINGLGCDGGGIYNEGQLTILDCCISNNVVLNLFNTESGGGIASYGSLTMS